MYFERENTSILQEKLCGMDTGLDWFSIKQPVGALLCFFEDFFLLEMNDLGLSLFSLTIQPISIYLLFDVGLLQHLFLACITYQK